MPDVLTLDSQLMCPHGGIVSAITENARVSIQGALAVGESDSFLIAGCPFTPGPSPHPCMQVQWLVGAAESRLAGVSLLPEASTGLCTAADQLPQGPPNVVETQPSVGGL